jgi:hypothetical protein
MTSPALIGRDNEIGATTADPPGAVGVPCDAVLPGVPASDGVEPDAGVTAFPTAAKAGVPPGVDVGALLATPTAGVPSGVDTCAFPVTEATVVLVPVPTGGKGKGCAAMADALTLTRVAVKVAPCSVPGKVHKTLSCASWGGKKLQLSWIEEAGGREKLILSPAEEMLSTEPCRVSVCGSGVIVRLKVEISWLT